MLPEMMPAAVKADAIGSLIRKHARVPTHARVLFILVALFFPARKNPLW